MQVSVMQSLRCGCDLRVPSPAFLTSTLKVMLRFGKSMTAFCSAEHASLLTC